MAAARCPKCGVEVGATWRWCLACGYDPDGSAVRVRQAAIERRQRQGGWLPVVIVLAGLAIGAGILWKTTPDSGEDEFTTPTSVEMEITSWERFKPPSAGFEIDLPALPEQMPASQTVTSAGQAVEDYLVASGPLSFRIMVFDTTANGVPVSKEPDSPVLDLFATELQMGYSGDLDKPRNVNVGRYKGNEFRITNSSTGEIRAKAVLVGRFLFAVIVSGDEVPEGVSRHVFDSLAIPGS